MSSSIDTKTHKDLRVWQIAVELVTKLYKITENYPRSEDFALKSQIRRAAVSVPANIAEGAARNSTKEFIQFLYISLGSLSELETLLIISENLGFFKNEGIRLEMEGLKRMLIKLIRVLKD